MMTDDVIMRTIIDLPEHQLEALGELCKRESISRAEAVRRAVEAMLRDEHDRRRTTHFGTWQRRGDARKVVDRLRGEWSR